MPISLTDLGIEPIHTIRDGEATSDSGVGPDSKGVMKTGSTYAVALNHVWSGERITVVDSPPGSGKTTLVADIVHTLARHSPLSIVVATPTKRGMFDLAERLVAAFGDDDEAPQVVFSHKHIAPPKGTVKWPGKANHVIIRTVASCRTSPPNVDLLVFDEAYQTTYSDASRAASRAEQVLMVGDPGQIGPVNRVPTAFWENHVVSPAHRAPEAFSTLPEAKVIHLSSTYRLGAQTVELIAPLYGFEFDSKRPDRHVETPDGQELPEIESFNVGEQPSRTSMSMLKSVARHAVNMIGHTAVEYLDGERTETTIEAADIAIVCPHNDQVTILGALINKYTSAAHLNADSARIHVGTADTSQGGQWKAVIALDPMIANQSPAGYQLVTGRLCVMLSRHMHHLTWVHDGMAEDRFLELAEGSSIHSLMNRNNALLSAGVRRLVNAHDRGGILPNA